MATNHPTNQPNQPTNQAVSQSICQSPHRSRLARLVHDVVEDGQGHRHVVLVHAALLLDGHGDELPQLPNLGRWADTYEWVGK